MSFKSGVKGGGRDRWWERRWWLWWVGWGEPGGEWTQWFATNELEYRVSHHSPNREPNFIQIDFGTTDRRAKIGKIAQINWFYVSLPCLTDYHAMSMSNSGRCRIVISSMRYLADISPAAPDIPAWLSDCVSLGGFLWSGGRRSLYDWISDISLKRRCSPRKGV